MPNYLTIQIATDLPLIDLNNHQNQTTKQYDSMNACIDQLAKLVGGSKSGTVQIMSSTAQTTLTPVGTNSQVNTFTF